MSETIYLQNVRLSFPHLVEPHSPAPNAVKKYSADFIMSQDHPGFKQFMGRVAAISQDKWKENSPAVLQMIQADRKLRCFGGPADKVDKKTFKPYSGYDGNVYVSANKDQMPQMIRLDGTPVDAGNTMEYQQLARKLYGGCFVNAAVRPWVQENQYGRGIRCDMIAIQFASDGEAFGEGAADASSLFGAVGAAAPVFPAFLTPQ